MPILEPIDAANAARLIYNTLRAGFDGQSSFEENQSLRSKFNFTAAGAFKATSGGLIFLKAETGFGVVAKGQGVHANEAIVITRGTDTAFDMLTDADIGIKTNGCGHLVHAGFYKTFSCFEADLRQFFRGFNPSRVHCVGHSLGGALATLAAEWVTRNNIAHASLYTFGSPRVGFEPFATTATQRVTAEHIFRVQHKTDIVPCVPVWPFAHTPKPGQECFIITPGAFPGGEYHKMGTYIDSVSSQTGKVNGGALERWQRLRNPPPPEPTEKHIETWLGSATQVLLDVPGISMISSALKYTLTKALEALGIGVQSVFMAGFTLVDRIAEVLAAAAKKTKEVSALVLLLMRRILAAAGKAVVDTTQITAQFVGWVLRMLATQLYRIARLALHDAHKTVA
jgi:triacylglycerol lipase